MTSTYNIISLKPRTFSSVLKNQISPFKSDPRNFQILFLGLFLSYGLTFLDWERTKGQVLVVFAVCLITQCCFSYFISKDFSAIKSSIISSLSICLILNSNSLTVIALAAFLSIASKFVFTFNLNGKKKHFFNPTNFGIIVSILLTGNAWISPGQWGSSGLLLFGIGILGLTVLLKAKRLDVAISFLVTFFLLHFIRNILFLGWEADFLLHQFTSGTLLLFTFFMITDPASTPFNRQARMTWAAIIAIVAFYLNTYLFVNGAPLWALFFISPSTLLFDKIFTHSIATYKKRFATFYTNSFHNIFSH